MPPQLEFADHNVFFIYTAITVSYTHTEFFRKLVLRGRPDANDVHRILVDVKEGQKLYHQAERKAKL